MRSNDQQTFLGHRSAAIPLQVDGHTVAAVGGSGGSGGLDSEARAARSVRENVERIAAITNSSTPHAQRIRPGDCSRVEVTAAPTFGARVLRGPG